jgi:AraC-like DNA-binding protein
MSEMIGSFRDKSVKNLWFYVDGYYAQVYKDFDMPIHSHNRGEVLYVASGEMCFDFYENQKATNLILKTGEYLLIQGGVPHKMYTSGNIEARLLNIEFSYRPCGSGLNLSIQKLLDHEKTFKGLFESHGSVIKLVDDDTVKKTIVQIQEELNSHLDQRTNFLVDSILIQMFVAISRSYYQDNNNFATYSYVRKALLYIEANYSSEIDLNTLAKSIGIHIGYLRKMFKEAKGVSIIKYINLLKIRKACTLLQSTNVHIKDIYKDVGFNNRQNFDKTFKDITHMTPNEYRQRYNNNTFEHYFGNLINEYPKV